MLKIFLFFREFTFLSVALRIVLAMIIGGFIGFERGKQGRAAGMRTHILVCLGATLTVMIGIFSNEAFEYGGDPLRIAAQVVSGIGFLGVGTILVKGRFQITGLTTAAGLWATAAIGLALGAGFLEGALITFACAFLTVAIFHKLEYKFHRWNSRFGIYVEINSDTKVRAVMDFIKTNYTAVDLQVTAPRSGKRENVGIEAVIDSHKSRVKVEDVREILEALDFVVFAIESI
jgi:putative Mg2+ transporter-C (MgtC) family protein